jgi:hypothetical protein
MSTLSTNQIVVEYIIKEGDVKKAKDGFDKLTQAEKDAIAAAQKLQDELEKTGKQGKDSTDKVSGGLKNVGGVAGKLGPMLAGAFSVAALVSFGKQVFEITGKFQTMATVLKNTLGSDSAAYGAMSRIQEIAAKTPFSVEELTASFVKLANQGFKPTNEEIIKLGDLASSTGKSFDQLAEALIDAQVGEFERLKEFGVRAQKSGDQVTFTFKGVETTVKNTNDAIRNYVTSLGDAVGVSGAMAKQSETLDGQISNLGDNWDGFLVAIGNRLAPVYESAIQVTSAFLGKLKNLFQNDEQQLKDFEGKQYNRYTEIFTKTSDQALKNAEENSVKRLGVVSAETEKLKKEYEAQVKEYDKATETIVGGGSVAGLSGQMSSYDAMNNKKIQDAKKAYEESLKIEKALKAQNQAALDEIIKRKDAQKIADAQKEKDAKANAEKLAKANKEEYDKKVKQLELEKQITAEKIKQTVGADGQKIAMMELEFATNLKLQKESEKYAELGVQQAKDKAKVLPEIVKTQNQEITQEYINAGIRDRAARVKGEDEVQQGIYEAKLKAIERNKMIQDAAIESENLTDFQRSEKLIQNEILANEQIMAANDEAANNGVESALDANAKILLDNEKLYRELRELRKKDAEDRRKKDAEIVQASAQVASAVLDGFMNLQQQQTQNELAALNSKYESEIRLAGDNEQKVMELNEKRRQEEKQLRIKEFEAQRAAAIAQVVFKTAPIIAEYFATGFLAPLAIAGLAIAAAQIGFIAAQPVPEFKEGTKGKPFKGGKAIVGEIGKEWVVTTSGQVYETPGVATLVDLPKGSQVIPHNEVIRAERYMGSKLMREGRGDGATGHIVNELISIKDTLSKLPITSLTMDERGFTKKIQTKSRETRILNNRFGN